MNKKNLAIIAGLSVALLAGSILSSTVEPFGMLFSDESTTVSSSLTFSGKATQLSPTAVDEYYTYYTYGETEYGVGYYLICKTKTTFTGNYVGVLPGSSSTKSEYFVAKDKKGTQKVKFQSLNEIELSTTGTTNLTIHDGATDVCSRDDVYSGTTKINNIGQVKNFSMSAGSQNNFQRYLNSIKFSYRCDPSFEEQEFSISGVYKTTVSGSVSSYDCYIDFDNNVYKLNKVGTSTYTTFYFVIDSLDDISIKVVQDSSKSNPSFIGSYVNLWTSNTNLQNTLLISGDNLIANLFTSYNDKVGKQATFKKQ